MLDVVVVFRMVSLLDQSWHMEIILTMSLYPSSLYPIEMPPTRDLLVRDQESFPDPKRAAYS